MANDIVLKNVTKRYKNTVAVDNLSLEIKGGEFVSLLGVNGAGKTTTIKMLSCLTAPDEGEAFLGGHSVRTEASEVKKSSAFRRRKRPSLRFLPSEKTWNLSPEYTVFPRRKSRKKPKKRFSRSGLRKRPTKKQKICPAE